MATTYVAYCTSCMVYDVLGDVLFVLFPSLSPLRASLFSPVLLSSLPSLSLCLHACTNLEEWVSSTDSGHEFEGKVGKWSVHSSFYCAKRATVKIVIEVS